MNSAARRLFLFFFSFAALTACEDPKDIGLELQDENLIGTEFTDTLTIQTGTVFQGDSIVSFRTQPPLLGQYIDPVLGKVRASTITEVSLNGSSLNFGAGARADSLVLTLDYSFKYADTLKAMQVNVHRVTGTFDERTSYFTTTPFAYNAEPVGSKAFLPRIDTETTNGVTTKKTRLLKVKLSQELANEFMAQSGQAGLASQAGFENFFKGIALTVPEGENASIIGLTLNSTNSSLALHYTTAEGTARQHNFLLGSGDYFTQLTSDRTGTAVAALQANGSFVPATETGGDSYVQSGTQLLTKITIPHLDKFKDLPGNRIINRAELIIPIKAASAANNLTRPQQLALYETNNANQFLRDIAGNLRAVQQDGINPLFTTYPALVASSRKNGVDYYTMNVTSYLQGVMMGMKPNNGLMLGAVSSTSNSDRTVTIRPELRPYRAIVTNNEANPVKLLIYYSKLQD
ncbi:DUF4270 domain-containing protein [Pontibacter ramchanderi]|uniref:Uncharacterized protein DUF4270 n=1 Tax=Pontibacter ramchanderi TaxID=1179743 RepID=A0A2N3UCR2_9BACT|nr:DUF4270 domain-containing protein [Pontibacter ramchanderi]PKV67157.1 uncharacterized protein DUF4270 [Pontibacter ramchanderi]